MAARRDDGRVTCRALIQSMWNLCTNTLQEPLYSTLEQLLETATRSEEPLSEI